MPMNNADSIAEAARLCASARAKLPASGSHRLRVLLDMLLIDLTRDGRPPRPAGRAGRAVERGAPRKGKAG